MIAKIAAIQMRSSFSVADNLAAAGRLLATAKEAGAKLAVLPEMFAILGKHPEDRVKIREKFGQGLIQDFLSTQAKALGLWIIGGTIPIDCGSDKKVRASCLVYNDRGENVARYDKIHLFDATLSATEKYFESDTVEAGETSDRNIVVIATPVGRIGLSVCYDIRFPELMRKLIDKGAEVIVAPSAFTVPSGKAHWDILTKAVSVQNFCYFVGAGQGGSHDNGRQTYGHSVIIAPWGNVLTEEAGDVQDEAIIYADIDLAKVTEARNKIPTPEHRRFIIQAKA